MPIEVGAGAGAGSATRIQTQQAWDDFMWGRISQEAFLSIMTSLRGSQIAQSLLANAIQQRKDWYASREAGGFESITPVTQRQPTQISQTPAGIESATDPLTGYFNRLGIGGKVAYNPAERFQANLFAPWLKMYDVSQIQSRAGMGPSGYSTLNEYLTSAGIPGTGGTGSAGMTPLFGQAAGLLKNVFQATPEQQGFLDYEPGSSLPEGATEAEYDPGNIAQLQDLMKYGLRATGGEAGSQFVSRLLPQLQRAYYGQKSAGGLTAPSFLTWLQQNYPSMVR